MGRKLTATDVCQVTGYTRDQFKNLLRELSTRFPASSARVAREFSPHDLIVFSVVRVLDSRMGMRRRQIGAMLDKLQQTLLGPREVGQSPYLAISFEPLHVEYVSGEGSVREGVLVSLEPIFDRVDRYLGAAQPWSVAQDNLRLPPAAVRPRRRQAASDQR